MAGHVEWRTIRDRRASEPGFAEGYRAAQLAY